MLTTDYTNGPCIRPEIRCEMIPASTGKNSKFTSAVGFHLPYDIDSGRMKKKQRGIYREKEKIR